MAAGRWLISVLAKAGEGRRFHQSGPLGIAVEAASVVLTGYLMWYALFAVSDRHLHGSLFFVAMLPIIFVTVTASKALERITVVDYLLAVISLAVGLYYALNNAFYYGIVEGLTLIPPVEKAIGILLVALGAEACRRTIGWGLTSVLAVLLAYVVFGQLLTGGLHHDPIELEYFVVMQTVTNNGIFGVPLQVAATYAFLFMLFGSFYHRAGGCSSTSRARSPGAPSAGQPRLASSRAHFTALSPAVRRRTW